MTRRYKHSPHTWNWFLLTVMTAVCSLLVLPSSVLAGTYGTQDYGNCQYTACSQSASSTPAPQHTVSALPSGLQVAVNLINRQSIPRGNYPVIITPLNGAGSSFKKADIYINDKLVDTVMPGQDGTATWDWNTQRYPGSTIKIIITDINGQQTTQNFSIHLVSFVRPNSRIAEQPDSGTLNIIPHSIKQAIKRLSKPVVYGFPYLLLTFLGLESLILLLQARRELLAQQKLQSLLTAEKSVLGMKQTFLQLASHYLRTPDTLIKAGAEGLLHDTSAHDTVVNVQAEVTRLDQAIENIITTSEGVMSGTATSTSLLKQHTAARSKHFGYMVFVSVPAVLIGIAVYLFVYIANHVTAFTSSHMTIYLECTVYVVLVTACYISFRRFRLRQTINEQTQVLLNEQQSLHAAQDALLDGAIHTIRSSQTSLESSIILLPASPNQAFISRGLGQLQQFLRKCAVASSLKSVRSADSYQDCLLSDLVSRAIRTLKPDMLTDSTRVQVVGEATLTTQNPELLVVVVGSLFDNALSYSPPQTPVTLSADKSENMQRLSIHNEGPGISAEAIHNLFQPFYKIEGAEKFNHEGMGFSLYLDKMIMHYLGGEVIVDSKPNKGVTVELHVPLEISVG